MKTCSECGWSYQPCFTICECGASLPDQTVETVVAAWFEGDHLMFDLVQDSPEVVWLAILQILERDLTGEQRADLAAGLLEGLIAMHGPQFIVRIEAEAKRNLGFNHLLGGVWRKGSLPEIWERVERARKEKW
jgi:hypothetical protein